MTVAIVSHLIAFLAYAGLAALVALGNNRETQGRNLLLACLATCLWSGSVTASAIAGRLITAEDQVFETLRTVSWLFFLYRLLAAFVGKRPESLVPRWLTGILAVFAVSTAATELLIAPLNAASGNPIFTYSIVSRLLLRIAGISLLENLARNSGQKYWAMRFLFVGLGTVFAFDLFFYSEALLFQRMNPDLYAVRGMIDGLAVPLIALSLARNPNFTVDIHVSRQFVYHSMTLVGTGLYFILMALAGYYLRNVGGSWGLLLQTTFLAAAVILVLVTLSSGTFRSALRNFVTANFFSYRYDYRKEWLQFIALISARESFLGLQDRVIQAIANVADSPAGALWLRDPVDDSFANTTCWNVPFVREKLSARAPFMTRLESGKRPLVIQGADAANAVVADDLPDWLPRFPRVWIVVPLPHRDRLIGFLILTKPRARRSLSEEDHTLLMTLGYQAASYIAEEEAGKALLDAKQLEIFNQNFAFVVHDIKNIVSQLSLILSNAEKHGDNPEFQRDVMVTVRHSVGRMRNLLEQLNSARARAPDEIFDLGRSIRRRWPKEEDGCLKVQVPEEPCPVRGDEETLLQILRHLLQNAFDAISPEGHVEMQLQRSDRVAVITIIDDGRGMTPDFLRHELFRPFRSTKGSGYGIGVYQARELLRQAGGRLDVDSVPGKGTEVTIVLPVTEIDAEATAGPSHSL
jgi:putative PEP-CTERM system histidine kinase